MKSIPLEAVMLLGLSAGLAQAQAAANCAKPAIQTLCAATCGALCSKDAAFLSANGPFCSTALSGNPGADDPVCGTIPLAGVTVQPPQTSEDVEIVTQASRSAETGSAMGEQAASQAPDEDCMQYKSRPEQLRCQQNKRGRPTCSTTAVSLEDDAQLLVTEVSQELEQYGDLLTRDLTDVASRDLLCRFSLDDLDQNYQRATNDPAALRSIQRRADSIQQCRQQWEDYLRNRATSSSINDNIIQNTADSTRKRFEPLTEQLQNLSSSITTLEQAASTIDGLIIIHMDFCPSEGIQPNQEG